MSALQKNVASQIVTWCFVNASTGAALTGASSTIKVTTDGTQGSAGGTATELGSGQYKYVPTQAETNGTTVGFLFTASGAIPVNMHCFTTVLNPGDMVRAGMTSLPNAAAEAAGGMFTRGSGTGQINQNVAGQVDTRTVTMSSNVVTAAAIADASFDSATFAPDTGMQSFRANTATAGGASSITLDASASSVTDFYIGCRVVTTGGTGTGQVRVITAYSGTTKVATVDRTWGTNPDATTTFAIRPVDTPKVNSSLEVVGSSVTGAVGSVAAVSAGAIVNASYGADTITKSLRSSTATAGGSTSITLDASASAVSSFYLNTIIVLTGGTGAGQARFITAYNGGTKVATVGAWATNPDNTSTFSIVPFDSIPGATAPTAAQNATAVWQDLLAGSDFSTASSIGKLLKDDIDATISSRQATASFPSNFASLAITAGGAVTVGTNSDKTGYGLSSSERNSTADAILDRDMSTGTDSGSTTVRTPRQALRAMRNKWSIVAGALVVTKEDDTTTSWTGTVTQTAGDPVSQVDPA